MPSFFSTINCPYLKFLFTKRMVHLSLSQSTADLEGILSLQHENLSTNLSQEEKDKQGFVTIQHNLEQLQSMHSVAPHVLAIENDQVVGYVLAMTLASREVVPLMVPLFENFDQSEIGDKKVTDYNPMVVGQVCVGKSQRGTGLFDKLYTEYREQYASTHDFAITSVALSNYRSLAAHQRVGFKILHTFQDSLHPWAIVCWDWNNRFLLST
jgi:L-amino acid N-acyltransferase YncA